MLIQNKRPKLKIQYKRKGEFILGLFMIGLVFFSLPNIASASWMDAKWLYRAAVPITAHTAAETNVYTTITIDTATPIAAGKMQADCGDIRVAKFNGATLPYFINASPGCNNVATTIQVYFTSFPAGAQTIYYYYGNPTTYNGFKNSGFATAATGETIGTVGSEEQSPNPVGYWKFDDGQGQSTKDGSGQGNNGTLGATSGSSTDDPTWITEDRCVSGKCLKFDGVGTYVNVGDPANGSLDFGTSSFSISAWVRTGSSSNQTIVSKRNSATGSTGYRFRISSTGALLLTVTDESANQVDPNTSGYNLIDNKWHYVEVVANRTTNIATFYVDGKPVVASASDLSSVTGSISNNIGLRVGFTPDSAQPFDGFLDNVKIYNYARTAAQIRADYNAGKNNATAHSGSSAVMGAKTQDYLSSGLVGYWKMDETSGDAADSSGNSNTGTWAGTGSHYPAGKFGNGGGFNGTDDYVTKATTNISTAPLTVSAWFKTSDVTQSGKMIVNLFGGNYYLDVNSGTARFVQNGIGAVSGSISNNTWYHLVGTIDSSNQMTLYINGVNAGSRSSNGPTGGGTRVTIGAHNGGSSDFLNGTVDEVRVYNRALSPTEISSLYNWAPGPVGYWDFEEKTSTSTYDTSGNGNTGALGGGATAKVPIWATGKIGSALNFDGINDLVEVTNESNFDFTNSFTVEAWIQPTGSDTYNGIVGKYVGTATGWDFILTSGKSRMAVRGTDSIDNNGVGSDLRDGKWHHVVAVVNGTSSIITYTDGKLIDTTTGTWTAVTNDGAVEIGDRYANDPLPFRGKIDQVRIYNYARTQKQVVEDMNAGHPSVGSPVGSAVGHWKFDEGQGTTAKDTSLNVNSLTLSSVSWTDSGKFGKAWNGTGALWASRADDADFDVTDTDDYSISLWFKSDSATNPSAAEYLFNKAAAATAGYAVYTNTSGNICFGIDDDTTWNPDISSCSPTDIYDATWHHIVAVRDHNNTDKTLLYVDGVLKDSDSDTTTATLANSLSLYVGDRDGTDNGDEFNGDIDEIKVYRYALTADEVKTDYNKGQALQMSAAGNNTTYAAGAANQEYCVPGDSTSCAAPVARWDFEEKTGNANDSSGNGYTGTLNNSPGWTRGKYGSALDFGNGESSEKSVTNGTLLDTTPSALTLEMWFKPTNNINSSLGTAAYLMAKENINVEDRLKCAFLASNGAIDCWTEAGNGGIKALTSTTASWTAGTWYHLAFTWDTTNGKRIFINGKLENSDATATTLMGNGTASDFYIGAANSAGEDYDGAIDQVKVFNYARSPAQVAYDYNRGGPVGWWKMDECQGGTIYDSSGNRNNGTITIGSSGTQTGNGTCVDGMSTSTWANGATGKRNSSLNFDGTDDYVSLGDLDSLITVGTPSTLSFWMKPTAFGGKSIISKRDIDGNSNKGFDVELKGSPNNIMMTFNSNTGTISSARSSTALSTDTWTHVTITYNGDNPANGSDFNIYINGVLGGATNVNNNVSTIANDVTLAIGGRTAINDQYYSGQIDDVRVYNYALTATQIRDLYTNGSATFAPVTGAP